MEEMVRRKDMQAKNHTLHEARIKQLEDMLNTLKNSLAEKSRQVEEFKDKSIDIERDKDQQFREYQRKIENTMQIVYQKDLKEATSAYDAIIIELKAEL